MSNNLSQQAEMNEWNGRGAGDHQNLVDGWHAPHVKMLDIYIVIFIKPDYPGFLVEDVIPMSIFFFISPRGRSSPFQGPDAWWSSVRWACNVGVVCHAGTGCEVPLTLASRDWACVGLRKLARLSQEAGWSLLEWKL